MARLSPLTVAGNALGQLMLSLAGPVVRLELMTTGRRGRVHVLRTTFLLALMLFFAIANRISPVARTHVWTPASAARFAELFLFTFLCVQFVAVLVLTPVWLGGAIAEERDRRRLEFLLTTRLGNAEIVLGKLVAGLARTGLVLLAGLPVLCVAPLWGGIDPNLLLAGYVVTIVGMVSVASLSVLCSMHASKPHQAIVMTYLAMIAFAGMSLLCRFVMRASVLGLHWPAWIADGNILVVLYQLRRGWQEGKPPGTLVPSLLLHFCAFHCALTLACVTTAVLRLRRAIEPPVRRARRSWKPRLPRVVLTRWPMLWKEIAAEPRVRLGRFGWSCVLMLALVSLVPVFWPYLRAAQRGYIVWHQLLRRADLFDGIDVWGRLVVTCGALMALVSVAIHAAGSFSRERERHTLDSLLVTPLTARQIVAAKWLGSILSVRRLGLGLLAVWLLCTGIGSGRGYVLLAGAVLWLVYAGCAAMLGVWFSLTWAGTRRATLWTLVSLATLTLGHWLLWAFVRLPAHQQLPHTVATFGLTPPAALHWLALNGDHRSPAPHGPSRWTMWEGFQLTVPESGAHGASPVFRRFTSGEYSLRPLRTGASPNEPRVVLTGIALGLLVWIATTAGLGLLAVRRLHYGQAQGRGSISAHRVASPCLPYHQPQVSVTPTAGLSTCQGTRYARTD